MLFYPSLLRLAQIYNLNLHALHSIARSGLFEDSALLPVDMVGLNHEVIQKELHSEKRWFLTLGHPGIITIPTFATLWPGHFIASRY